MVRNFAIFCLLGCLIFSFPSFAKAETMTIQYAQDFEPFSWLDDGRVQGILVDFLDEILGKRMGISLKHEVGPWARSQLMVRNGERDAFFTIPTAQRRQYTEISALPLFSSDFVLYTGANNPNIEILRSITKLADFLRYYELIHISIRGSGWHNAYLKKIKYHNHVDDSKDILTLLKEHRADVYIEQESLVRYQMNRLGMKDFIVEIPNVMDSTDWSLCVGKKSAFVSIMPAFNALLEQMTTDGSLEKLREEIFSKYE